jgi:MurNAc alpha-1-phosphate uridylyltransferase
VIIDKALILAAGFGTRMKELTKDIPKPLLPYRGRPIIDYVLERLAKDGVRHLFVNTHYLGAQIANHMTLWRNHFDSIRILNESTIRGTGGTIQDTCSLVEASPFFVVNGDIVWNPNPDQSVFKDLAEEYLLYKNPLLAVVPRERAFGYAGEGDFDVVNSQVNVPPPGSARPFVYGGIQVVAPKALQGFEEDAPSFSCYRMWLWLMKRKKLRGYPWEDPWFHLGTKEFYLSSQALNHETD